MKKLTIQLFCVIVLSTSTSGLFAQDQMIGEIRLFAGNFAPRGWALCQGQLLNISQYTALFSILGTTYGGDGRTTFALPDLRGRVVAGTGNYTLGQTTNGQAQTTNNTQQSGNTTTSSSANSGNLRSFFVDTYGIKVIPASSASANAGTINSTTTSSPTGGTQTANTGQPLIALNYIIALQGIFPPRN
ncbi:MAG TPA: tail fiber protein [Chitinophagaceae bacterium]|nr:tail fiber protein [Chitinophagaceae bacterium]HRX92623.1 tail fiber protein [Chitinophagaceae bacterium]